MGFKDNGWFLKSKYEYANSIHIQFLKFYFSLEMEGSQNSQILVEQI